MAIADDYENSGTQYLVNSGCYALGADGQSLTASIKTAIRVIAVSLWSVFVVRTPPAVQVEIPLRELLRLEWSNSPNGEQ